MQKTTTHFRPKARIMELLGEQLIKNHTLALFEIVKNSYDADASEVKLTLQNIDQENGIIEIRDDGYGMSFKTVKDVWMEPAHGHKLEKRLEGKRTGKGRLQVGEKGVGRFAVHRLGTKITMVTKSDNTPEVVVNIDWEEFSKSDYLDQAEITISEREAETFVNGATGTYIKISNLKQKWRRGEIRKLYRSVKSMTPAPLTLENQNGDSEKPKYKDGFEVTFKIEPPKNWLDDLFDPELAESQSLFCFSFELSNKGLHYDYKFTPYAAIKADYHGIIDDRDSPITSENFEFFRFKFPEDGQNWKERNKRPTRPNLYQTIETITNGDKDEFKEPSIKKTGLGIGTLKGKIIGFDFDKEIMRYIKDEKGGLEEYVKQQGGIKVYRDGLRVYNYGEPGDDWLGLDHRRIQGPTRKFGSKQIIGEIHLELEGSPELKEKTNREGFVENDAYNELVYAMLCIISQFEAERNKDKRRLKDALATAPGKQNNLNNKKGVEDLLNELEQSVLKNTELDAQIGDLVRGVGKSYRETRDVMLSAAGAGLGLITVFHELERGVKGLNASIQDKAPIDQLQMMSNELVSILQGAMYMVSNKKMEEINASDLVKYALLTQQRRFKRHNITFLDGFKNSPQLDFKIKGMRRMLTSALVNVIDNAIYWLDENEAERYIWISPTKELESPAIIIADNGPGFIDGAADIIQPFHTRKPAGMGIGLYYTDLVMKSHAGRLAFPEKHSIETPKVITGAQVGLVFKKEE
ncbi:ATP-binding protein [Pseudomonas sp. RIT778]|uniref:ATP-binding protein n=1 Tax=Pseudomonas sp. RIT778 TaxID=2870471 RepID=UPI001C878EBD|nr:ATP-binding protein [Pseudomonas sp. RIT778]MBX8472588.1 ATP-binding protein [Pseudomonas sp. RIT778]